VSALRVYLAEARAIFAARAVCRGAVVPAALSSPDQERLRWFPLPGEGRPESHGNRDRQPEEIL
jgi:hypothetical protein